MFECLFVIVALLFLGGIFTLGAFIVNKIAKSAGKNKIDFYGVIAIQILNMIICFYLLGYSEVFLSRFFIIRYYGVPVFLIIILASILDFPILLVLIKFTAKINWKTSLKSVLLITVINIITIFLIAYAVDMYRMSSF